MCIESVVTMYHTLPLNDCYRKCQILELKFLYPRNIIEFLKDREYTYLECYFARLVIL